MEPRCSLDDNLHIAKQELVRFEEFATHRHTFLTENLLPSDILSMRNDLADESETEVPLLFGSPCLETDGSL